MPKEYPTAFLAAVEHVLALEGPPSNNPGDYGGETVFGLSRRWNLDVNPWPPTREQAIAVYFRKWWAGQPYASLPSFVAAKMFVLATNMDPSDAARCLQRALRSVTGQTLREDGVLGSITSALASTANQHCLLAALKSEGAGWYRVKAARDRSQQGWLEGWLNRAYA